jgi:hypothetical protein
VYPKPVLDVIRPDVQAIARIYEKQTGRPQVEPRYAEVDAQSAVQVVANVETR